MKGTNIIVNVNTMEDIKNIDNNTKYINIGIDNVDIDIINYFLEYGNKYSYTDSIDGKNGFIYATYDMFKKSELIIKRILDNMPSNIDNLSKVRYIYISLGRLLGVDINTMDNKNESISFGSVSVINNIWGSLYSGWTTSACTSKMVMYLCSRIGIKSELINSSINGDIGNKIFINDNYLITNLYNDLYNIQGGFRTKYFDKYNDNIELDKKILYVINDYVDVIIDKELGNESSGNDMVSVVLDVINRYIDVPSIGVVELSKICDDLFKKYCSNCDIKISNLFLIDNVFDKNHFIVIGYNDMFYSYNYNKKCFIKLDYDVINKYIKSNKIGLYEGECFNLGESRLVL